MSVDPKALYVHGTIASTPILGVSNRSQIKGQALRNEVDIGNTLIKSQAVKTVGGESCYKKLEEWIAESDIICIWGLSLGMTDAHWWKQIINWLRGYPEHRLLVFWHTKSSTISQVTWQMNARKVFEHLQACSGIEEYDMKFIKKRIHIILNTENVLRVKFPKN